MTNKKYLYINSRDELYRVDIASIAYFEAGYGLHEPSADAAVADGEPRAAGFHLRSGGEELHCQPYVCISYSHCQADAGAERRCELHASHQPVEGGFGAA